jgi:HEAT repeat protein
MHGILGRGLLGLTLGCLVAGTPGCASHNGDSKWSFWPFGPKTDTVPGLVPPSKRIAAIQQRSAELVSAGADRQDQFAREMAAALNEERDPVMRTEIVRAVSVFRTPTVDQILRCAVKDVEPEIRILACKGLGKRGGDQAAAALSELVLSDADADVRMAAVRALGETRSPRGLAALGKALDEHDPAMQYYAVESLRKISGKDFGNDLAKWRQYARGESPVPVSPVSFTDRIRKLF